MLHIHILPLSILARFTNARPIKYCRHISDLLPASGKENGKGAWTEMEVQKRRLAAMEVCVLNSITKQK